MGVNSIHTMQRYRFNCLVIQSQWLQTPFMGFVLICYRGYRFCRTGCNTLVSENTIAGKYPMVALMQPCCLFGYY